MENSKRTNLLLYLTMFLLAISNDIERNPGPSNECNKSDQSNTQYPCGTCDEPVTWDDKGIVCDNCNQWYHAVCQSMDSNLYMEHVDNTGIAWDCILCGCPNYSTFCYSLVFSTSNHFSILSDTTVDGSTPTRRPKPVHSSTPDNMKNKKSKKGKTNLLRIVNVNFQSIKTKQSQLYNLLDSTKPDVIFGTETWLDSSIKDNEIFPPGYNIYRNDRNLNGGGVLIVVKDTLISSAVPELHTDCEIVWCKLELVGHKAIYLNSYYNPKTNNAESYNQFEISINRASSIKNAFIISAGDFNLPGWDWKMKRLKPKTQNINIHHQFTEILDDYGLTQIVEEPTRGHNTLDLILTNYPESFRRVEVIPGISDHDIVYTEVNSIPAKLHQKPRQIALYKKANWENLKQDLINLQEEIQRQYNEEADAETMWTKFVTSIQESIKTNIPHKTARKKDGCPWITADIKRLIRRRDRAYKKKKKSGDSRDISRYKELKSLTQKELRKAYWRYIDDIVTPKEEENSNTNCMKRFWTYIKHKKSDGNTIPPLKSDGLLHDDPIEKANILNSQFQQAFSSKQSFTKSEFSERCKMSGNYECADDINFTLEGIRKLLNGLNPYKSAGPDDISPRILKEMANEIAPILLLIFKRSYESGKVPSTWKTASVCPIYKKGKKFDPINYRPVSLTCICCKIMEHIVTSHIMTHADKNDILYNLQHGFRKQLSCETQLIEFIDDVTKNLDAGKQTDCLIMDFSKAFDKVSHSLLTHKLDHYGIRGKTNKWIENFLQDRSQQVLLEGEKSTSIEVESGVPQGSVLGPSLFLYYINDMPEDIASKLRLFADDTISYMTVTAEDDTLQDDLNKLAIWEEKWMMKFHPDKCQVLTISKKKEPLKKEYTLHNHVLEHVTSAKYLGVTMTSDLKWDKHINTISQKANKTIGFLKRNLNISNTSIKEKAYTSLVRPIVEYSSTVWDPHLQKDKHKLEMIQRRAARYVTNRYHNTSSVSNMIQNLNWTSLEERRKNARLTLMYKIVNHQVKIDATDRLIPPDRYTRHMNENSFQVPSTNTTTRRESFYPKTIRDWNALPNHVCTASSLDSFKSLLASKN